VVILKAVLEVIILEVIILEVILQFVILALVILGPLWALGPKPSLACAEPASPGSPSPMGKGGMVGQYQ